MTIAIPYWMKAIPVPNQVPAQSTSQVQVVAQALVQAIAVQVHPVPVPLIQDQVPHLMEALLQEDLLEVLAAVHLLEVLVEVHLEVPLNLQASY